LVEFNISPKDRDASVITWLIIVVLLFIVIASLGYSENVSDVVDNIHLHVGTIAIVLIIELIAWAIGRGAVEKVGLWSSS